MPLLYHISSRSRQLPAMSGLRTLFSDRCEQKSRNRNNLGFRGNDRNTSQVKRYKECSVLSTFLIPFYRLGGALIYFLNYQPERFRETVPGESVPAVMSPFIISFY